MRRFTCPPIEPFIDTPNITQFWRTVHGVFKDLCTANGLVSAAAAPEWQDGSDFFAWLRGDHFQGRRVVVFCDEFDRLYSAHPLLRNHVLKRCAICVTTNRICRRSSAWFVCTDRFCR